MNKKIAINNFQYTYFLYNRVKKKIVKNELFNKWYKCEGHSLIKLEGWIFFNT